MNFPSDTPVTPAKLAALRCRLARLGIALDRVDEQAVRCSGPGGQKANKTSSGVLLRYQLRAAQAVGLPHSPPAGQPAPQDELLVVKWTRERYRALNRFLALRQLADEIEARVSPQTSARLREQQRIRRQKDRARRRRSS